MRVKIQRHVRAHGPSGAGARPSSLSRLENRDRGPAWHYSSLLAAAAPSALSSSGLTSCVASVSRHWNPYAPCLVWVFPRQHCHAERSARDAEDKVKGRRRTFSAALTAPATFFSTALESALTCCFTRQHVCSPKQKPVYGALHVLMPHRCHFHHRITTRRAGGAAQEHKCATQQRK